MSNALQTIEYSNSSVLKVDNADNRLVGLVSPDSGGRDATVFMFDGDGFAGMPNATVDLTITLGAIGGSPILAMIGSNFSGPGHFNFQIIADGEVKALVDKNVPEEHVSEQWPYQLVKV